MIPTSIRSLISHALVSTMELSKATNHGVNVLCHLMLDYLNSTPGSTAMYAMPTNVLYAKGMISVESDRIWREWLNEQIWRAWQ